MSEKQGQSHPVPLSCRGPFPSGFGRYTLLRCLGEGGMGIVFLAQDSELHREVALKVPQPQFLHNQNVLDRFQHEARAAARLEHDNLCPLYDIGEIEGLPYLCMRYIRGKPLFQCPQDDQTAILTLVRTLATALMHAHQRGVIHRDLKPANILISTEGSESGKPIIMDFGLALRLETDDPRLTSPGGILGTPKYMAPEQIRPDLAPIGPWSDVYSLGVIFYELLTGVVPFIGPGTAAILDQVVREAPVPPSQKRPGLNPHVEPICLRMLAKSIEDRYGSMEEVIADIDAVMITQIHLPLPEETAVPPAGTLPNFPRKPQEVPRESGSRPQPISADCIQFSFAGYGAMAPETDLHDRVFLDVGNALRPGVIDHHQLGGGYGSTTSLVLYRPDLVWGVLTPGRQADAPFTLVLHEQPDLDGVASAYLVRALLTTGSFPPGAEALARYVDKVDEGSLGMNQNNPFSLYAGYYQLVNRLARHSWRAPQEHWRECVRLGIEVVGHVVQLSHQQNLSVLEVDAFTCPEILTDQDRQEVQADLQRYLEKLRDPQTHARRDLLQLPGQFGGKVQVDALRVRDVQNLDDPQRVLFFKDWARSDAMRSRVGGGFGALSVFQSEGKDRVRRCILSVRPDTGAHLRGLSEMLDSAESTRRKEVHGVDDRVQDPSTGEARQPRPGYQNADPWYDGRAHEYTIVDSPRSGTLLTADEIEALFLTFGGAGPSASSIPGR